eukprot:CAMPEP_0171068232 /NCGR_PEP_ID=MMETSP0766_2-20121228/8445_1 /TAXON_ID=439317 /ORGANISM="Gambierdiscus australes, Strain CAWD 149" /LENGTH=464 /DNA_ID=CAMNT_0011524525 /DNA_START=128 /DNA_END=1522 /DNA_ORIENTATION=+
MRACSAGIAECMCGVNAKLAALWEPLEPVEAASVANEISWQRLAMLGRSYSMNGLRHTGRFVKALREVRTRRCNENCGAATGLDDLLRLPPDLSFVETEDADQDHATEESSQSSRAGHNAAGTPVPGSPAAGNLEYPELAVFWEAGSRAQEDLAQLSRMSSHDLLSFARTEVMDLLDFQKLHFIETFSELASDISDVFGLTPRSNSEVAERAPRQGAGLQCRHEFVKRLQDRANEVELQADGWVQLPLIAPCAESQASSQLPDTRFGYWMAGGDGKRARLRPQSFFIDYDDVDMSITALGKTYGPQRKPGDPYTMRPFLTVVCRKDTEWVTENFLDNFEVRYWDYELGYVTTERWDSGVILAPHYLGPGAQGEHKYSFNWMQTLPMEVALPASCKGPLLLTRFGGRELPAPVPLFRLRMGLDQSSSQWYLAPLPPARFTSPEPAFYNIGFASSMRMVTAYLQLS